MTTDRRSFFKTMSLGSLATAAASPTLLAQEALQTAASPVFKLSLAAYAFKRHFAFFKGKSQTPQEGKAIDMFEFIDYCADLQCGAELTSYFFPPDADEAYYRNLKRHAFLNGVPITGTAIGNNFTIPKGGELDLQIAEAKGWIDRAAIMGAPHIRFFAGTRNDLEKSPAHMENAIEALQECVNYAAKSGVFIGVENHGDLSGNHIVEIVKGIKSDWFGVNLDTGNFVSDDPYAELVQCAPYAINVQLKFKMKTPKGRLYDADLGRVSKILQDARYRGNIVLEYEEEHPFKEVPAAMTLMRRFFRSN
ncbi:MAG: sugar phosphate isomerase/epimerase family protein [Verrucomicrobiaceae bacterium]